VDELPYRRLTAWQHANELAIEILELVEKPPIARHWFFRNQVASCAMSVAVNLAEGHGRGTDADFASFVDRARGSLFELDNWLLIAARHGWLSGAEHRRHSAAILEINAMLFKLRASLRTRAGRRST
jgi:four helix bundle protein